MTELESLLKTSGMDRESISKVINIPYVSFDVIFDDAQNKISSGDVIKLSYASGKSVTEIIAAINNNTPISKMTEAQYEVWKNKYHKTKSDSTRRRYIFELCAITGVDIPNLVHSMCVRLPKTTKILTKNGIGFERLRALQEKYKDYYIPQYDVKEIREYYFREVIPTNMLKKSEVRKLQETLRKEARIQKPLPKNKKP